MLSLFFCENVRARDAYPHANHAFGSTTVAFGFEVNVYGIDIRSELG